ARPRPQLEGPDAGAEGAAQVVARARAHGAHRARLHHRPPLRRRCGRALRPPAPRPPAPSDPGDRGSEDLGVRPGKWWTSRGARAASAATTDEVRRAGRAPGVGRRRREERAAIWQRGCCRAPPDRSSQPPWSPRQPPERSQAMPRAKGGPKTRRRHKKTMKQAQGYVGGRRKTYRQARETVERGLTYAYRDRKQRKRD